jgi:hypothetical protein
MVIGTPTTASIRLGTNLRSSRTTSIDPDPADRPWQPADTTSAVEMITPAIKRPLGTGLRLTGVDPSSVSVEPRLAP